MSRQIKPNGFVVESLRILVVIFGAALGLQIARAVTDDADAMILGFLTAPMIGVIVGAGLGYSLGGGLARYLVRALDRSDRALEGITPEELVSGSVGALVASALVALISWPVFLLVSPLIALSIFAFLVVLGGAFGFTVAQRRREAVLASIGSRTSMKSSSRPRHQTRLLDSSVAIDGRIVEVARAGFALGRVVMCQPVLDELQQLADTSEETRRNKGRRGLETLDVLRRTPGIEISVIPDEAPEVPDVDGKLVQLALKHNYALLTMDTGLAKVAAISGVEVQNLHALSIALRPPVTVGESLSLHLIRPGKEADQGVGYLDDGTMVVVEQSEQHVGSDVEVEIMSVLMTSNGRMAFARRRSV
ncbi:MAG: hypothetical protein CMH41_02805 [Micrococcales bacterium]|nr:hypothetical protein [Micrococcales bacterium]